MISQLWIKSEKTGISDAQFGSLDGELASLMALIPFLDKKNIYTKSHNPRVNQTHIYSYEINITAFVINKECFLIN